MLLLLLLLKFLMSSHTAVNGVLHNWEKEGYILNSKYLRFLISLFFKNSFSILEFHSLEHLTVLLSLQLDSSCPFNHKILLYHWVNFE